MRPATDHHDAPPGVCLPLPREDPCWGRVKEVGRGASPVGNTVRTFGRARKRFCPLPARSRTVLSVTGITERPRSPMHSRSTGGVVATGSLCRRTCRGQPIGPPWGRIASLSDSPAVVAPPPVRAADRIVPSTRALRGAVPTRNEDDVGIRHSITLATLASVLGVIACSSDGPGSIGFPPAPIVATVTVSPTSVVIEAGGSGQLSATARDASGAAINGRSVTWSSTNVSVATVSSDGFVSGITAGGPVSVSASVDGRVGVSQVTVTPVPVASVTLSRAHRDNSGRRWDAADRYPPGCRRECAHRSRRHLVLREHLGRHCLIGGSGDRYCCWGTGHHHGLERGEIGHRQRERAELDGRDGNGRTVCALAHRRRDRCALSHAARCEQQPAHRASRHLDEQQQRRRQRLFAGVVTGVATGGPVTITATSEGRQGTAAITVTSPNNSQPRSWSTVRSASRR